jgi:tRNA threonylcarbamoyladenosine biosynthesis protein TsaB
MSRILAVETATRACSAALLWNGECREILRLERNRHAEILIPMARQLLAEAGFSFADLDALAFGSGPGSFTGLRIGISVVQGLALGIDRPVVPVSSLWALAARVSAPLVLAAFDARMEQVYWNLYRQVEGQGMAPIQEPRVDDPVSVRLPSEGDWVGAGSGCDVYGGALSAVQTAKLTLVHGVHPHAENVARIAESEFSAGRALDPRDAAPEYVRNQIVQE